MSDGIVAAIPIRLSNVGPTSRCGGQANCATIAAMEIVNQAVEEYMLRLLEGADGVQREMEELARREDFPIVGPLVGRVLLQLARLKRARRILELGSGFGYSAWWFAQALDGDGEITLTEFSPENVRRARDFLGRAELRPRLRFLEGDALQSIDQLEGEFDIVFIDVDKPQYPLAFQKASSRLVEGGMLITDNVLWSGRVADPEPGDAAKQGILQYNRLVFSSPRFLSSILPIRDGVAVSLRI